MPSRAVRAVSGCRLLAGSRLARFCWRLAGRSPSPLAVDWLAAAGGWRLAGLAAGWALAAGWLACWRLLVAFWHTRARANMHRNMHINHYIFKYVHNYSHRCMLAKKY